MVRSGKVVVPLLAVLLVAGCSSGGDEETQAEPQPQYSSADVDFAMGMIPHHGQAVEMADLALEKAGTEQIRVLAGNIKAAQDPEITQFEDLLTSWNKAVPKASGHAHGQLYDGMMTAEQMAELEVAEGPEFEQQWTESMIAHHEGAVQMSETVLADSDSSEVQELAQSIVEAQGEEIAQLQELLKEL
ncbi:DUF305 domain-containing protein [Kineosporia babensis]